MGLNASREGEPLKYPSSTSRSFGPLGLSSRKMDEGPSPPPVRGDGEPSLVGAVEALPAGAGVVVTTAVEQAAPTSSVNIPPNISLTRAAGWR